MKKTKLFTVAVLAMFCAPPLVAQADDKEIPFAVAEVFFELNNTDGDLGIHALIDGDPWKRLTIEDKRDRTILDVSVRGRLRRQGLTEIFFESAEPTFDRLPPEKFFRRFPAGTYDVEGRSKAGQDLESEAEITHAMPAPPAAHVNGIPMALQCDDEEPGYDAPTMSGPVVISWPPVTTTHADLGSPRDSTDIVIYNYQVVVETELEGPGGEFASVLSVILPPNVTELEIPAEFLQQNDSFKYEVLARESSYNQTAVESCFLLDDT